VKKMFSDSIDDLRLAVGAGGSPFLLGLTRISPDSVLTWDHQTGD
jgi:hypothetical protein